jgi:ABC-type transporter Mla subunit MlaD
MSHSYLQLRRIAFTGPKDIAELAFSPGVNVICGASDTGKSFLAESIDYMLGGSELREIPERIKYGEVALDIAASNGERWQFRRATAGGNFSMNNLDATDTETVTLKQAHGRDKTDNISGFLLEKIGLLGKRILKSGTKATTLSLSFRNLARLVIIQEGEIQQTGSPFWGGQFTLKTAELATIKLLLTGVDDSNVVPLTSVGPDNSKQIALIEELLSDLMIDIADLGEDQGDLLAQLDRLEQAIEERRESLKAAQHRLDDLLAERRGLFDQNQSAQGRLDEIMDLLARFELLRKHYAIDLERLTAVQESGSMFTHVDAVSCPLCGALPGYQHLGKTCAGDVEAIILAASVEIQKIKQLQNELTDTVSDLESEASDLGKTLVEVNGKCDQLDAVIHETVSPQVSDARSSFAMLVEKRASVQRTIDLYTRVEKLEERKLVLQKEDDGASASGRVASGLPDPVAHSISMKISAILKEWNFPGDCHVYFDKERTDFVIDGKPRGSRGKGLRAITHAAITIGLLEYCQENDLPHPGFIVLDSPLLAYFKPEGDDDLLLKGTDLKDRFYQYLINHHSSDSQVIIIENQHPPTSVEELLSLTVFTGNPNEGRLGFL